MGILFTVWMDHNNQRREERFGACKGKEVVMEEGSMNAHISLSH